MTPSPRLAGRVAVVIPALDEAGNIAAVVSGIRAEAVFRSPVDLVIVVDNGSTDGTAAEAAQAGAMVVAEPIRGYGRACHSGTRVALGAGVDIVVYMDGDRSSRASELERLIGPIRDGRADLVLGSRLRGGLEVGSMAVHQRFGNWLTATLMRRFYGLEVSDLGPFRAVTAELIASLDMEEMTFGWPTEMMVKAAKSGARVVEVPVSWDRRGVGSSKVSGTIKGSVLAGYHILGVTLRHARRRRGSVAAGGGRAADRKR